jgi:hypothetical protein
MAQTDADDGHFVHWGTGAGTAAKGDTDVFTAGSEARAVGTVSVTGSGATAKYQVVGTLTADGAKTITNGGNFELSTGANIIVHGDHTGIVLALNDKIEYTITLDPS